MNERVPHLDKVQDQLVSVFGGGHLAVADGFSQCLLGNEGVQVEDGGQTAVQTDELVLVGAEVNWRKKRGRRDDPICGGGGAYQLPTGVCLNIEIKYVIY